MKFKITCENCKNIVSNSIDKEYMNGHYVVSVYHDECMPKCSICGNEDGEYLEDNNRYCLTCHLEKHEKENEK